jgi:hypothetical protein
MFWFGKKMPDAVVRRFDGDMTLISTHLVRTFRKDGKRWCDWRGDMLLLLDDGSVIGDDFYALRWSPL